MRDVGCKMRGTTYGTWDFTKGQALGALATAFPDPYPNLPICRLPTCPFKSWRMANGALWAGLPTAPSA